MAPARRVLGAALGAAAGLRVAAAAAGAWTQDAGDGLQILTFVYDSANAAFEARGGAAAETDFTKYEIVSYTEFGLTDRFTVVLNAPFQHVRDAAGPETREITGAGEVEFAVRAKLFERGGFVGALQPLIGAPGEASGGGQAPLEPAGRFYEVRGQFGAGGTLGDWPAFASIEGGYRARTGPAPDEWRADVALGVSPTQNWQVLAQSFTTVSAGEARAPFGDFRSHKLQLSGVRRLSDAVGLQVGGFRTVAGRNVIKETGAFTAVWFDWSLRGDD